MADTTPAMCAPRLCTMMAQESTAHNAVTMTATAVIAESTAGEIRIAMIPMIAASTVSAVGAAIPAPRSIAANSRASSGASTPIAKAISSTPSEVPMMLRTVSDSRSASDSRSSPHRMAISPMMSRVPVTSRWRSTASVDRNRWVDVERPQVNSASHTVNIVKARLA